MKLQLKRLSLFLLSGIVLYFAIPQVSAAQVNTVFFLEVTNVTGGDADINNNIRKDNPFNKIRGKLFLNSWLTNEIGIFSKFLYDEGIKYESEDKLRLEGAYFLFDIEPEFKVKVGKIPINIGVFPQRNYMEKNPLIGSPLMYQYKTPIRTYKVDGNDAIIQNSGQRKGVSILYEACWDHGIELFGSRSIVEYSFAVTNASVFTPAAASNKGEQYIGRIGLHPKPGLRFGVGFARAPYLTGNAQNIPEGKHVEDYIGQVLNVDFEYSAGYLEFFAEFATAWYKSGPSLETLSLVSYFLEGKYTLSPRLFAAGRFGQLIFDDVAVSDGTMNPWDYDVNRIEIGLGYRLTRSMVVKGIGQLNIYKTGSLKDIKFVALQLKAEL